MKLSPARFNRHLNGIGQKFMWRKAFVCPCVNPASGAATEGCPLCHAKGRLWNDEVRATAGFTNLTAQKGMGAFGTWEPGDATLTIGSDSPMYGAGQYDRFRALNATDIFSINNIRGERDYVLGTVKEFTRVFWLNDTGDTIIEGGLPVADATGNLSWPAGSSAPPDGQTYSVSGVKYEEYFSYLNLPSNRNEHGGRPLPKKLLARRFDLFGR